MAEPLGASVGLAFPAIQLIRFSKDYTQALTWLFESGSGLRDLEEISIDVSRFHALYQQLLQELTAGPEEFVHLAESYEGMTVMTALQDALTQLNEVEIKARQRVHRVLSRSKGKDDRDLHRKLQAHLSTLEHALARLRSHKLRSLTVSDYVQASRRKQVLNWLCEADCELKQVDLCRVRVPGSGNWLFSLPNWTEFISHEEDFPAAALWCIGKPGSGKSMLMSLVVEKLKEEKSTLKDSAVVYYYFDSRERSTSQIAMASILRQLCYSQQSLSLILNSKWAECEQNSAGTTHTKLPGSRMKLSEITTDFMSLIPRYDRLYICLDGADECEDIQELTGILQRLVSSGCRLFITSRKVLLRFEVLFPLPPVHMEGHNLEDIRLYLDNFRLHHAQREDVMDTDVAALVMKRLLSLSGGSFLTVILQLEELSRQTTTYELEKRLSELPVDLTETFRMVLSRVEEQSPSRRDLASRILIWMAYAYRPLTYIELRQAITIDPYVSEGKSYVTQAATDPKRLSPPGLMEDVCMGLVTIDPDLNRAIPTHSSLAHYLQEFKETLFPDGNGYIATCCLSILRHDALAEPARNNSEYDLLVERLPLCIYLSQYWGHHLRDHWKGYVPEMAEEILRGPLGCLTQLLHVSENPDKIDSQDYPRDFGGTHFRIHFNLYFASSLDRLNPGESNDLPLTVMDSWGRTLLHITCQQSERDFFKDLKTFEENQTQSSRAADQDQEGIHAPEHLYNDRLSKGLFQSRLAVLKFLVSQKINVNDPDKDLKTPLHYAVIRGSLTMVHTLINATADVNVLDHSSLSPLDYAAGRGHLDITSILLANGAQSSNALWIAASAGHRLLVRRILRFGIDTKKDRALLEAAKHGFSDVFRLLRRAGAEPTFVDTNGMTALHHAAISCNYDIASRLAFEGADINKQDNKGRSPLQLAAESGDTHTVRFLVERGGLVELQDRDGRTALIQAVENGHSDVVKYLVRHRNYRSMSSNSKFNLNSGSTTMHEENAIRWTPLQLACKAGSLGVVQVLLEAAAYPDDAGSTRRTPLSCAAENGHTSVVKLLLSTGRVNVNAEDLQGRTALSYAAQFGNNEVIIQLLKESLIRADTQDKTARTPLSYAAENGHLESVTSLLAKSVFAANKVDSQNQFPEDYANRNGHARVAQTIIDFKTTFKEAQMRHNRHS